MTPKQMKRVFVFSIIPQLGMLSGCFTHQLAAASLFSHAPDKTENAEQVTELLHEIASALPSYQQDGLARFEGPEIATVEADLKRFEGENCDAVFPEDYVRIQGDWDRLVGLDATLQKEHLI